MCWLLQCSNNSSYSTLLKTTSSIHSGQFWVKCNTQQGWESQHCVVGHCLGLDLAITVLVWNLETKTVADIWQLTSHITQDSLSVSVSWCTATMSFNLPHSFWSHPLFSACHWPETDKMYSIRDVMLVSPKITSTPSVIKVMGSLVTLSCLKVFSVLVLSGYSFGLGTYYLVPSLTHSISLAKSVASGRQ